MEAEAGEEDDDDDVMSSLPKGSKLKGSSEVCICELPDSLTAVFSVPNVSNVAQSSTAAVSVVLFVACFDEEDGIFFVVVAVSSLPKPRFRRSLLKAEVVVADEEFVDMLVGEFWFAAEVPLSIKSLAAANAGDELRLVAF